MADTDEYPQPPPPPPPMPARPTDTTPAVQLAWLGDLAIWTASVAEHAVAEAAFAVAMNTWIIAETGRVSAGG